MFPSLHALDTATVGKCERDEENVNQANGKSHEPEESEEDLLQLLDAYYETREEEQRAAEEEEKCKREEARKSEEERQERLQEQRLQNPGAVMEMLYPFRHG